LGVRGWGVKKIARRERERERRQNGIATKVRDGFPRQSYQMQGG
jgi:hypothetical protein